VNGRELRAARKQKIAMRFAALAEPVAPPVEMDEAFFLSADLAYTSARDSGALERERIARGHEVEVQRLETAI
jgi:hypothetical protein